jgi:hypothetical protein
MIEKDSNDTLQKQSCRAMAKVSGTKKRSTDVDLSPRGREEALKAGVARLFIGSRFYIRSEHAPFTRSGLF